MGRHPPWGGEALLRHKLSALLGPSSWLIFDILELTEPQDWLLAPSSTWPTLSEFKKFEEFARNLAVVNDLAERVSLDFLFSVVVTISYF